MRKLNNRMKNILLGAGSVINIAPPKKNRTAMIRRFYNPAPSSTEAIKRDWVKVGDRIVAASKAINFKHGES